MVGLLPDVFWSLGWNDYDSMVFHHYYQLQQDRVGARIIANQVRNSVGAFAEKFKPLREAAYWPLPLVDPPALPEAEAPDEAWWDHMRQLAAKSGKRFAIPND